MGCTWPIFSAVVHAGVACRELMNNALILALAADDMTDLLFCARFNTTPLFFGSYDSSDMKK